MRVVFNEIISSIHAASRVRHLCVLINILVLMHRSYIDLGG